MTEIWNKKIITINDEDFSAGDTINYLRWELEDGSERELFNVIIRDIAENGIIIGDDESEQDIFIEADSII